MIRPGESISQYLARLKYENRLRRDYAQAYPEGTAGTTELEPAVVSAQRVPSEREQRQNDWEITKNKIKALTTEPVARRSLIRRYLPTILVPAFGMWLDRHPMPDNMSVNPTVVDMSSDAFTSKSPNPDGRVLMNEYVEMHNPNIRSVGEWKQLPDSHMIRDAYDVPKSNISLYQGVENGQYKIGGLNEFSDTTTVVPVRTAKGKRVKSVNWQNDAPSYTYEDGTAVKDLPFDVKGTFGNDKGGVFVNKPFELDSLQTVKLNNVLKRIGPAYPVKQDSGSYSYYETAPGENYLQQGAGYNNKNVFLFGVK